MPGRSKGVPLTDHTADNAKITEPRDQAGLGWRQCWTRFSLWAWPACCPAWEWGAASAPDRRSRGKPAGQHSATWTDWPFLHSSEPSRECKTSALPLPAQPVDATQALNVHGKTQHRRFQLHSPEPVGVRGGIGRAAEFDHYPRLF